MLFHFKSRFPREMGDVFVTSFISQFFFLFIESINSFCLNEK